MKKTILMIGASERHAPLIKSIKESMDIFVVAIDKDENAPGNSYCDVFAGISVKDMHNALWFAECHEIDGCVAIPDIGAETGAYINSSLNLKGIKHNTYIWMTDKTISKWRFEHAGVKVPANYPEGNFPYIIKPSISTGSKGVIKLDNEEHLSHFLGSSKYTDTTMIIEEYIEGDMFSVDLLMQDGKIKYGLVQDRFLGYKDCFVDSLIVSPSKYGLHTDVLFTICKKALDSLGFSDGPANLQFIVKEGDYYLIEVNPRISGPYGIECHTMSTHVDWFFDIVIAALGNPVIETNIYPLITPNSLITIGAKGNGYIDYVTYPDITGTVDGYWRWKGDGEYVNKITTVKDSIEHIFIMEDSLYSAQNRAKIIFEETQVHLRRNK